MKGKRIKKTLFIKSCLMVYALILLLIPINFIFYLKTFHQQQRECSQQMFHQIEQVIEMNEKDLNAEKTAFSQLCIQKADMVAYFVEHEPDVTSDLQHMQELARVMDVDEIHFFNEKGEIYTGTHPEYYGYTVYTGEQIGFFAQMLEDTTRKLCQDIRPNTAEGKEMQYAAVWLSDKSGFVQIGMRPERLLSLMEEKSLQSIVGSIPFERREYFHIFDSEQGKITASSVADMVGRDFSGEMDALQKEKSGEIIQLHRDFHGKKYCVYIQSYEKYVLIHTYASQYLLGETLISALVLLLSILLAAICVIAFFIRYVNRYIVNNVLTLNEKLKKIEQGDLEELDLDTKILEFNSLIYYINQLLRSIRFDNRRILHIMNSRQISLGIFEYNAFYKKMFCNQWMKKILGIDESHRGSFESEKNFILGKLKEMEQNCADHQQGIYRYDKNGEILYLKTKKYSDDQSVIYYMEDVSSWWKKINVIKDDSFKDVLTGLLNRRGIQENAKQIFAKPEVMKEAAVILADADGLKRINDLYGHVAGDAYIKEIADLFSSFPEEHTVSARLGGDEFVMILYGCHEKEEVQEMIRQLRLMRGTRFSSFQMNQEETLEFSMGYAYYPEEGQTYQALMRLADERMYKEKRKRKSEVKKS